MCSNLFPVAAIRDSSYLVVLKFHHASEVPGGLVKTDSWTLFHSFWVCSLWWSSRICISEKFSKYASLQRTFENHWPEKFKPLFLLNRSSMYRYLYLHRFLFHSTLVLVSYMSIISSINHKLPDNKDFALSHLQDLKI